jgi:prophage antirepressor-like protein
MTNKLIAFENQEIRRILHENQWWFSVVDVVSVLTTSPRARKYWADLKIKLQTPLTN